MASPNNGAFVSQQPYYNDIRWYHGPGWGYVRLLTIAGNN